MNLLLSDMLKIKYIYIHYRIEDSSYFRDDFGKSKIPCKEIQ